MEKDAQDLRLGGLEDEWIKEAKLYSQYEMNQQAFLDGVKWLDTRTLDGSIDSDTGCGRIDVRRREMLLGKAIHSILITLGVLRDDSTPTGPELLCATECFCASRKPPVTDSPCLK